MIRIAFEILKRGALPLVCVFAFYVIQSMARYEGRPSIEEPIHLAGGAAAAYFFSRMLSVLKEHGLAGRIPRPLESLFVFSLCATAAVFWEFAEYLGGMTGPYSGLEDTVNDLALGILGGGVFVVGAFLVDKLRRA